MRSRDRDWNIHGRDDMNVWHMVAVENNYPVTGVEVGVREEDFEGGI